MALSANVYQWISQQGLLRFIDASSGPAGPTNVLSFWLVPALGYINGQRVPHDHQVELEAQGFDKTVVEGLEYFLVPEESTNLPGLLSHYAGRTGVADLANAPGGGVNRVRGDIDVANTVAPDAVAKYVEDNDSYEEARTKTTEEQEIKDRAVDASTPAREPGDGKLITLTEDEPAPTPKSKPVAKTDDKA